MMPAKRNAVKTLGATCPGQGSFYVCENSPTKFVGCCTIDPCKNDGVCPTENLYKASFDNYSYNEIKAQDCVSTKADVQWWSCAAIDTPFMGCCDVNPCLNQKIGCPASNLYPAKLSDNEDNAKPFLANSGNDTQLSGAAIAGIVIAAVLASILIIGGLVFLAWRKQTRKRHNRQSLSNEPFMRNNSTASAEDQKAMLFDLSSTYDPWGFDPLERLPSPPPAQQTAPGVQWNYHTSWNPISPQSYSGIGPTYVPSPMPIAQSPPPEPNHRAAELPGSPNAGSIKHRSQDSGVSDITIHGFTRTFTGSSQKPGEMVG